MVNDRSSLETAIGQMAQNQIICCVKAKGTRVPRASQQWANNVLPDWVEYPSGWFCCFQFPNKCWTV